MTKLHQLVKQVSAIEMHPGCMNYYWQPEKNKIWIGRYSIKIQAKKSNFKKLVNLFGSTNSKGKD